MLPEDLTDDLEERAEELLSAVLELTQDEVDAIYREVRPNEDSRQWAFASAQHAAELCDKEQRLRPPVLHAALAQLCQMDLGLTVAKPAACVLLIDQDVTRLVERRKLFSERRIETKVATSAADGVANLEAEEFQLVIVDYYPVTEDDKGHLLELQRFNVKVPVINVQAWTGLMNRDNGRLNRELLRAAARMLGKPVPRRLPAKRPPGSVQAPICHQPMLDIG
ncbi:MAG: hypothetical protein WA830_03420 [Candidatus Sulfotelmatobacter sp.]